MLSHQLLDADRDRTHLCRFGERQGKEEFIPAEQEGIHPGGDDAGERHRYQDTPEGTQARSSINHHRFVEFPWKGIEVAGHHQNRVGQGEYHVRKNQGKIGVVHLESHHQSEIRDQERDRRNRLGADDEKVQWFLQREGIAAEAVSCQNGYKQREKGDGRRHKITVEKESHLHRTAEDGMIGLQGDDFRQHFRREGENLRVGFNGAGKHPQDGEASIHQSDCQPGVGQYGQNTLFAFA